MEDINDINECDPSPSIIRGEFGNVGGITTPIVDDCL
jgi:hypothetical protein